MPSELDRLRSAERSVTALRRKRRDLEGRKTALGIEIKNLWAESTALREDTAANGLPPIDWGELGGAGPISPEWGADRGRCVDRWYIEAFLEEHRSEIAGRILEVHDDDYSRTYGGRDLTHSEVLDIDATNTRATLIDDLQGLHSVKSEAFDTLILTQTLQLIRDPVAALRTCRRVLAPEGRIFLSVPCLSRVAPEEGLDGDRWRWTPAGLRRLLRKVFSVPDEVSTEARGNLLTSIAFLEGLACEDLSESDFLPHDPYFPLLVTARVAKKDPS